MARVVRMKLQWVTLVVVLGLASCRSRDPVRQSNLPPAPGGSSRSTLAQMTGDDPDRCVKQVIVGGDTVCFEFNRDYYWCRGEGADISIKVPTPLGEPKPEHHVLPVHYERLYFGGDLGCGMDKAGDVFCWGDHSGSLPAAKGRVSTATPIKNLPKPIDEFSVASGNY